MRRAAIGLILALALPRVVSGLGGSEEPPHVTMIPQASAFSPDGDGARDAFLAEVRVTAAPGRVVSSAALVVYGAAPPDEARLLARVEQRVVPTGPVLSLVAPNRRARLESPVVLAWDGSGADGERLPDGAYLVQAAVEDDRGAFALSPPIRILIDTEPPLPARPTADFAVFSPDNDGVRDRLVVSHPLEPLPAAADGADDAPVEAWEATLESAGGVPVRQFRWGARLPATVALDGSDEAGRALPDGAYRYVLSAIDAAGNRGSAPPLAITIDRSVGRVTLGADGSLVSPNNDGVRDRVEMTVEVEEAGAVASWSLVGDPLGAVLASGSGAPPSRLAFTGRDEAGTRLPDGTYLVSVRVTYGNGTSARSQPRFIRVDATPPQARLRATTIPEASPADGPIVFGGSTRRAVRIAAEVDEAPWEAVVSLPSAVGLTTDLVVPLAELELPGEEPTFLFDGTDGAGRPLADGEYTVRLRATDEAGNVGTSNELVVFLRRHPGSASLQAEAGALSPNGDGRRDSLSFSVGYSPDDSVELVMLELRDDAGVVVRSHRTAVGFEAWEWLGRADDGSVVPDGEYTPRLEVRWRNGEVASAVAAPVGVDTREPEIRELSVPFRLFSPNGDGHRDVVRISQRTSAERDWRGVVTGPAGGVVAEWRWAGSPGELVWDGSGLAGGTVPDGDYAYVLSATDEAGNTASARLSLVVDTVSIPASRQPPLIGLAAEPQPFTPDGDGVDDTVRLAIAAGGPNEIASWSLEIVDLFGVPVRTFSGTGAPPAERTWEGRSATGELIQGATDYLATLTVTDVLGNVATTTIRLRVGILVRREGGLARIAFPHVHFAAGSADPLATNPADARRNVETMRSLAEVLRRYPDREILVVGYAGGEDDPSALSTARAQEVRRALVILGVAAERLRAVGRGESDALVPADDSANVWKNRRVEFILVER